MPFPTNGLLDTFTRGDSANLGGDYEKALNFGSSSNRFQLLNSMASPTGAAYAEDARNVATYTDAEVYAKLGVLPNGSVPDYGLIARYQNGSGNLANSSAYRLTILHATNAWRIRRVTGGSTESADIITGTQTVVANDLFGFEVYGTGATVTLTMYHKPAAGSWTQVATGSDTSGSRLTNAGMIGLYSYFGSGGSAPAGSLDDLGGGERAGAITHDKAGTGIVGP
jgi:hypothetical protein